MWTVFVETCVNLKMVLCVSFIILDIQQQKLCHSGYSCPCYFIIHIKRQFYNDFLGIFPFFVLSFKSIFFIVPLQYFMFNPLPAAAMSVMIPYQHFTAAVGRRLNSHTFYACTQRHTCKHVCWWMVMSMVVLTCITLHRSSAWCKLLDMTICNVQLHIGNSLIKVKEV